jgi:RNA polymerase sigma-70 factor (family 1)
MEGTTKLFSAQLEKRERFDILVTDRDDKLSGPEATITDSELFIRHAFATDPRSGVELLYRHYFQPLCSHAVRLLYSKAIAEDLVSEIFFQFYANGAYQEIKTSYRAYLYKTVRNRALNYKRDECRCSQDLNQCMGFAETDHQRPDALAEYEELYQRLEAGIKVLPTQRRRIFLMHRFENKKYAQIADELQLSPRTVEVQIRKASHFLRDLLVNYWLMLLLLFLVIRHH